MKGMKVLQRVIHEMRPGGWLRKCWRGFNARSSQKKLRLCESLQFGDRRFIALIECEGQRYMIAGTAGSISLLRELPDAGADSCATQLIALRSKA